MQKIQLCDDETLLERRKLKEVKCLNKRDKLKKLSKDELIDLAVSAK